MIQAAPLVLSFARAVPMLNKLVGAVGITELGNRVNNYIQENPDESAKIVSMIMPTQGIANALKNKSSEDVEEVEETEEVTTGSGVEERIREILREAGVEDADNQDLTDLPKDLEAKVMSGIAKSSTDRKKDMIEASAIIGLSGPGRERKKMIDDVSERYDEGGVEDAPKPKFDFTKFYKNRRRRADGGAIGIEVLFEEKKPRKNFIYGGTVFPDGRRGFFKGAQADTKKGKSMSPGTTASGGFRGGNNNDGPKGPPVIISKGNTPEPITFNEITGKKMLPADLAIQKQFLNLVKRKGYETGLDTEADDLYNAYRTATGLDNFQTNALVNSVENQFVNEIDGNSKSFYDSNSTITDLDTGKSTKNLLVETPTGLIQRTVRPSGIMENDITQPFGAPQSLSVNPYTTNTGIMEMANASAPGNNFLYNTGNPYKDNLYDSEGNYDPYGIKGEPEVKEIEAAADGGRVGLFMGGSPLEGQALSIYDSMKAYNFSDQEIANALSAQGLYTAPGSGTPDTTPGNTIGYQGGNDGPIGGAPSSLVSGFKTQTQDRQNRLTNPNKVTEFFNKFTGGGQADIGEMIRTGQIDTRKTSGIPLGVGAAFAKMMPDKYYDMSLGDQVFTQSQMGYTGPTVFGENTSGLNKDPFNLNPRSAFGNYAEAVGSDFASLSESLSGRLADKYGVEFDEETGMFTGKNAELANKMTNMMRTKFNFRKDQLAAKNRLDSQIKAAERQRQDELAAAAAAKSKAAALAAIKKQGQASYNPNIHGPTNYGQDSQGNQSFDSGMGFGIGSDGGPVSNKSGKGRTGYSEGGLATMFKEKR